MSMNHPRPSTVGTASTLARIGGSLKKKAVEARDVLGSSLPAHVRFSLSEHGSSEYSTGRKTLDSNPYLMNDWRVASEPRDPGPLRYGPADQVDKAEKNDGVKERDVQLDEADIRLREDSAAGRSTRMTAQTLVEEANDQQNVQFNSVNSDIHGEDSKEQERTPHLPPELTTLLVHRIRENTAKQIKKFTAQMSPRSLVGLMDADCTSSSSSSQSRRKPRRKLLLQQRSARASVHGSRDVGSLCSGLVPGGAGPLNTCDERVMICRISRMEDEPYKFSIRRQGKCLYFEKAPTVWDSGLRPEDGDRILEVNGIRADNVTTHDRVMHALAEDKLVIRFGKCVNFPNEEAYVLTRITVTRILGEALGASFRSDNKWLIFDRIEDGLFKRWNAENPQQRIRAYDRLLSVNGFSGLNECNHKATMKVLDKANHLHLLIGKLKANPNPYESYVMFDLTVTKKDGQPVGLCLKHRGSWLVIEEIVSKAAVQDWIDANQQRATPNVGDVLVMINGISSDERNWEKIIAEMEQSKTIHFVFGKRPAKSSLHETQEA